MSRQPIKVRGKKPSAQTDISLLNPYPKDKRPLSSASHSLTPPAKSPRHTKISGDKIEGRQVRSAAPLEQLPTELLETIFLQNLNLSLPQASSIIGSKLTSKYVKTQLVLRACSAGTLSYFPGGEQAAIFPTITDHAEAQSAILRMKWVTSGFIKQLTLDYITTTLVREFSERKLQWLGKGPPVTGETESTIRKYLKDNSARLTKMRQDESPVFGYVCWRIENPSRFIRLSFSLQDGIVIIEERRIHGLENFKQHVRLSSTERHHWRIFCGINGCKVPEKLLHSPWTSEKCDFLEMVIRGNATVDWVGTTSGEIAERGLMQALREGNARATKLLVTGAGSGNPQGSQGFPCSSNNSDIQRLQSGPWPREGLYPTNPFEVRGIGVVPRTRHLRTAVIEAGCRQDVVETLLMAEEVNINVEDQAILDWAVEKRVQGDERGQWLLSMLSSLIAITSEEPRAPPHL